MKHKPFIVFTFLCLTFILGYQVEQSDFYPITISYGIFFALYLYVYKKAFQLDNIKFFIIAGLVLRFLLLFAMPNLSDDIYRFIWDGRLINLGLNPFDHLPTYYLENESNLPGINQALYDELNSPNYFTIYPPVAQGVFAIATKMFPSSIGNAAFVMKLFLFFCEAGSLFLLWKMAKENILKAKNILSYALNPLIIIEICGNIHFEGAMIFFLLLAYWLLIKNKLIASAITFALSIASKLLPLIFLPFLLKRLGWKKSFLYYGVIGISLLIFFAPLISGVFLENFGSSLDLYFRKFEFNASVYFALRWIGLKIWGYNLIAGIGPLLALGTLSGVLYMTWKEQFSSLQKLPQMMLWAICLYLFFTTTVHPWYLSLPIVLCCFTNFRFPILWSGLIFLTYVNYSYGEYFENLWVVGFEYVLVFGYLVWEISKRKSDTTDTPLPAT